MSIEVMKLAMEALESAEALLMSMGMESSDAYQEAVFALGKLDQAIEQAEQKPCLKGGQCKHGSWCSEVYCQEHCEFVEQAEQAQHGIKGEMK